MTTRNSCLYATSQSSGHKEREGKRERVVQGGGSKVAVLTQIKQHLVRVLTLSLSLSLSLSQFATTQTMGMWHVPGLPTTAGNAAIRTRMQIHWSMHFNWSYRSMSFSKTLRLNQRTTVITQSSPRLTLTFRVLNADYLGNIDKTLRELVCIFSWKNYYTFLNTFAAAILL